MGKFVRDYLWVPIAIGGLMYPDAWEHTRDDMIHKGTYKFVLQVREQLEINENSSMKELITATKQWITKSFPNQSLR